MRIILTIVASIGFIWTISRFRRRQLSIWSAGLWTASWLAVGAVALVPDVTNRLADLLGIGRGADVVLYGAVVVILAILFRISIRLEQLDRAITTVTRELALRDRDRAAR